MWHLSAEDQYLPHHFPANQCTFNVNMNWNQAFCIVLVIFLLQSISIQQQQMVAFFILYMRWINFSYQAILNIAMIQRRTRRLQRQRIAPYAWSIPCPAESWFEIHYNDPTVLQDYFWQQLQVYKNTFDLIRNTLNTRIVRENSKFRDCLPPEKVNNKRWHFGLRFPLFKQNFEKIYQLHFCCHTKVEVACERVVCWQILTLM